MVWSAVASPSFSYVAWIISWALWSLLAFLSITCKVVWYVPMMFNLRQLVTWSIFDFLFCGPIIFCSSNIPVVMVTLRRIHCWPSFLLLCTAYHQWLLQIVRSGPAMVEGFTSTFLSAPALTGFNSSCLTAMSTSPVTATHETSASSGLDSSVSSPSYDEAIAVGPRHAPIPSKLLSNIHSCQFMALAANHTTTDPPGRQVGDL